MRKRLLYILHAFYNRGGTEEHVRTLARHLEGEFEIFLLFPFGGEVVLLQEGREIGRARAEQAPWPIAPEHSPELEKVLLDALDRVRPDIIHVQHFFNWHLSLLRTVRERCEKTVISFHDYYSLTPDYILRGVVEVAEVFTKKYSLKLFGKDISAELKARADYIMNHLSQFTLRIAPSEFAATTVSSSYPMPIKIIEHGIEPFEVSLVEKPAAFGYVGSLLPQKGYMTLLNAFTQLQQKLPQCQLYVFGGADNAQCPEIPGVKYFGHYSQDDLPRILGTFRIGIIPSTFRETFGLVLSEMWMGGKPVIASAIGALKERVHDGKDGKLFPPGDTSALLSLMEWFLRTEEWEKWQLPTPRTASNMAQEYRELYRTL